jgi:osmoprotectant transport system ATP-binding protein
VIELQRVSKAFGGAPVITDLSLTVARGEFVVLIGASGSGKSTLLKLMNRMVEPDTGTVLFQGEPVHAMRAELLRRRMGYAIQSTGLFPHWTVAKNVAAVPTLLGWAPARIEARVNELLNLLGLPPGVFGGRYPHELSGGQQQRVGVARALAADPDVLLMDEPFGALDPVTRGALQQELLRIQRSLRKTIVFVTHDIDEALLLATRIVLIDHGRVVQADAPAALLARPANDFVAGFIGRAETGLRLLALQRVASRLRAGVVAAGEPVQADASLREALSMLVARGVDRLAVVDAQGRPLGAVFLADIVAAPPS